MPYLQPLLIPPSKKMVNKMICLLCNCVLHNFSSANTLLIVYETRILHSCYAFPFGAPDLSFYAKLSQHSCFHLYLTLIISLI